jgi:ATP-dependent DNA helicase RecG
MAISTAQHILHTSIEFLKGVGPYRAELLKKELQIATYNDLLHTFPFRFIDKSSFNTIKTIDASMDTVQIVGTITHVEMLGSQKAKRIKANFNDGTGSMELCWFNMLTWVEKTVLVGNKYLVYGKVTFFNGMPQITHPEIELLDENFTALANKNKLEPVYSSTEKLKAKMLNGRQIGKLTAQLFSLLKAEHIPENLSDTLLTQYKLMPRFAAFVSIHFPNSQAAYDAALRRLKFEELFFSQLAMQQRKLFNKTNNQGFVFGNVGNAFNEFYNNKLPFALTNAQKRVIKEIRTDTGTGRQMNRLLQGDVGSGKTIVALITMLIAKDNGYQSALMAPTEILARQHYEGLTQMLGDMPVKIMLLTGSVKVKQRRLVHAALLDGSCDILIGTHALIEDIVQFKNLGFVVIDEQHRFGVAQRARLWAKASLPPHMLVMTATPIPRTLAMTAYGDLDCSIMDELPPGRTPIQTVHRFDDFRATTMQFVRDQIDQGRQIYFIFPLIEESDKLDFENLMRGYENVMGYFPEPKYYVSMVHGRMKADQKNTNMDRFVNHTTQIMVSTTVIEVGVNVPNATVMIIESAERFGLSQLHQLRGRVGRGAHQSYCILLTSPKISATTRERMRIMESTNDGFVIAEKDMELRGPGDIEGTRQSGLAAFKLADIVADKAMLQAAHKIVETLLETDPNMSLPQHNMIAQYMLTQKHKKGWGNIS